MARAGHILAGVTWIGLLYFFNFVQVPAYAELSDGARSEALRKLTFRALWWFRYAALLTFLFGIVLVGIYSSEENSQLPRRRQRHRRSSPACSSASRCSSTCGA